MYRVGICQPCLSQGSRAVSRLSKPVIPFALRTFSSTSSIYSPSSTENKSESQNLLSLVSPLHQDNVAAGKGLMKRSVLPKYGYRKPQPLKHSAAYYDLSSTRPAPLILPEPLSNQQSPTIVDRAKYLYHLGRAYLTFYKSGLKAILANWKEYRQIASRVRAFDGLHWHTDPSELIPKMKAYFDGGNITRREYQLYLRTRRDLSKLLPFGLILGIFGEFSPFVLLAFGPRVIPFPCLVPKQVIHSCSGEDVTVVTLGDTSDSPKPPRKKLETIPSHTTWKSWHQQLSKIDEQISGSHRSSIIPKEWYHPHKAATARPLADALLVLWEGGVDTLDNQETLLWAWQCRDPYLNWLWKDTWFRSQRLSIEKEAFTEKDAIQSWTQANEIDLSNLRGELQLTLQDLVKHVELNIKTGLDYDRSNIAPK